jgi:hypothetical protein
MMSNVKVNERSKAQHVLQIISVNELHVCYLMNVQTIYKRRSIQSQTGMIEVNRCTIPPFCPVNYSPGGTGWSCRHVHCRLLIASVTHNVVRYSNSKVFCEIFTLFHV